MQKSVSVLACLLLFSPCVTGQDSVNSSTTAAADANLDGNRAPGYTIITTSAIRSASSKLADFVAHKEVLGFGVQVITEEDFGGGIGDEAAENIRAWLQDNYEIYNIEYVLLIGNPDPNLGNVPMKVLYPYPNDPNFSDEPTDLYYADLTGNWDLDGDEYYGEWMDDFGTGGVDRNWEVFVGRIPFYGNVNDLDGILQKTILYERETKSGRSVDWRKRILLPMNEVGGGGGIPGSYLLGEAIKDNILMPAGWQEYHRIYDEIFELNPVPETMPCTIDTVTAVWNGEAANSDGKYGLVMWVTHGGERGAADIMHVDYVNNLHNEYPSFTFQIACWNAHPETTNNLAYELLKNGAICTIGATRQPYVTPGVDLAKGYIEKLVVGLSSAKALQGTKHAPLFSYKSWECFLTLNIYGDPALQIVTRQHPVIYVDAKAGGLRDGSSWADACICLQDGLAKAYWGTEIRVAQGIYMPDEGIGVLPRDRSVSFSLKDGVVIKGGYAGFGGPDPSERNVQEYETILSGDIGIPDVNSDNAYHVVTAYVTDSTAVLDGFTITSGHADGNDANACGGGIYVDKGNPTIRNCIVGECSAESGGGMYTVWGSPTIVDCSFNANLAISGGGIDNAIDSSPILTNCIFNENQATNGGGMHCRVLSNATVRDCIFTDNQATNGGGFFAKASTHSFSNCTFAGNSSNRGGAIYVRQGAGLELKECKFTNNTVVDSGGGMFVWANSYATITNCVVVGNYAGIAGAMFIGHQCDVVLTNCTMAGNSANRGSTLVCQSAQVPSNIQLGNCIIWDDGEQIWNTDDSIITISYSNIQGGWEDVGNINEDPLFADPNNGDYHLKSTAGRWNPVNQSWVKDDVTSPCIDAGDMNIPIGFEPFPNGGLINIGAYGGTDEASKSYFDEPVFETIIAGDINGDCRVDFADFALMLLH